MSRLILLRHGQASFGAARYDALSDLGREQSRAAGRLWLAQGLRCTRVWVGPRDRHRETAALALPALAGAAAPETEPALNEFAEGQQILASAAKRLGPALSGADRRRYAAEIDAWASGGIEIDEVPAPAAFRATVAAWLARATGDAAPDQTVLAVTSGGVIAAVLAEVLQLPDRRMAEFMRVIFNASLTELAFSRGRGMGLVSFNEVAHLPRGLLSRV